MNKKIIFILIAIGSFLLYLPPLYTKSADYHGGNISIDLNEFNEQFQKPSLLNLFRKISSPFDFKFFNLYLEPIENRELNNCSYLYMDTVYQEFGNETLKLEVGERTLVNTIKIDRYKLGGANATYNINYSVQNKFNCNLTVDFTTKAYVEMNVWDALGNVLILFTFYSGLFLLFLEIKKKIE